VTPLEDDEDHMDAYYDNKTLCYRTVANNLGEESHRTSPRGSLLSYI
jgi:hypothetical protein